MSDDFGAEDEASMGKSQITAFAPLARRINRAVLFNRMLGPLIFILTCYAVVLIVLKMIAPLVTVWAGVSLLLLPVSFLYSVWQCRRSGLFFEPHQVAEVVDHLYLNDGQICTSFEAVRFARDENYYRKVLVEIEERVPRIDVGFYLRKVTPVLLFTALAVAVPARNPEVNQQSKAILESLIESLLLELEEQAEILPEEERLEMEQSLEEIKSSEDGISREQWEAIEEMRERMNQSLQASRTSLSGLSNQMNQLANVAQSAEMDSGNSAEAEQMMAELAKALKNQNFKISSQMQSQLLGQLGKMGKGAPDAEKLKELAERLQKMTQGSEPGEGQGEGDNVGRGGLGRGRADAAMVVGDEQTLENAKYEEAQLDQKYLSGNDLVALGVTPIEPDVDPGRFSPGTLKQFETHQGLEVSRSRISPRQKQVIEKFFRDAPKQ